MNIRENVDIKESKLAGIALILGNTPKPVVWWIVGFVTLLVAFVTITLWAWIWWMIGAAFSMATLKVGYGVVKGVLNDRHRLIMQGYERSIMHEKRNREAISTQDALTKLGIRNQYVNVIESALASGHNVKLPGLEVTSPWSNVHTLGGPQDQKLLEMPSVILPAKSQMIEVARRQDFNKDNLFLAQAASGDVTTTLRSYLHCANDGCTDSGKTSQWRGQLTQFLLSGIGCILLNPNFALVTKDGGDWKPLAKALQSQGVYDLDLPRVVTELANIGTVLDYMANTEIDRRFAMMREGDFNYKPLYLYIDEWPEIALKCKGANDNLGTLLRRGRAVELCVSVNSQGFLKEDTDLKGSARENFATTFFLGGGTYSGAKLLDISQKQLEDMLKASPEPIGKGVAVLRNNASMPNPEIVRLPYADNEFLYYTLGRDDSFRLPPETIIESVSNQDSSNDLDHVYDVCTQLKEDGKEVSARNVAPLVGMGKTKVAELMKALERQGITIR